MAREMKDSGYDWIGQVPDSWLVLPAQRGFTEIKRKNTDGAVQKALQFKFGTIVPKIYFDAESDDYVADTITAYNIVEPGTVMINGLNLNYDFKTQRCALVKETGVITSAYLALWPNASMIISEYATYLFKGYEAKMAFHNMGSGIRLTLGWKEFKKQPVLFPTITEQKRIVGFLDRKCAEIDSVIADTQRTIEEYKKLKQSVITQAVTKGIRGERPMKDSGIEWVGQIPSEWDVVRIKTLFDYRNERNNKPLEEVNLISLYTDKGVVQHCDLEETTGNKASNADGYKLVYQDDIVVNIILCWMGAIGRSSYSGVTSPAYDVYSPKPKTNSEFYHYYFRTSGFSGECYKYGRGIMAMRWRTYSDEFRALQVVCPSVEEQDEIVAYLDEKCDAIDRIIAAKQQLIAEMEVYKKSVIYEYVTGKKEVPACQ